ncbi:MAG TPA: hypothetical protein PK624_09005 [Spirochaetota bacterium]|nr:hypothetical protein [Spirochaetota bacterium]HOF33918.1 hypothetical protein [Spirochaetota bacterium]HOR44920.1 hypothetical protein [Spirochaetota bacterium]HPK56475.1 hypothetical protein [Spirochaetota bacterium]
MSQQNFVSVDISAEEMDQIKSAVDVLVSKLLPKLKTLNADEKKELPKMGDKTYAFVQKACEHCVQNPDLVPQFLDLDEFKRDVSAFEKLRGIKSQVSQIAEALSDTQTLSGSDAYSAALMFYNTVKTAKKTNVPKAGSIYDDLSKRYPGRPSKVSA